MSALAGRTTVVVVEVGGRAGRWACRSLSRSGYRVVGTFSSRHSADAAGGPFCDVLHPLASPRDDGAAFADGLLEIVERERAGVVMQTDNEAATEVLSRLHGRTSAVVVGADARQYSQLCDKGVLAETAKAAGLDGPRTVLVDRDGPREPLPPLPCIVKPATAVTGDEWRRLQRSASLVAAADERDERVAELVRAVGGALVQERVVGRAWRVHFVATDRAFAALPVITRLSYPRDAGMSTVQHLPRRAPGEIFAAAERLIRHTGYVGPGSVQFIEQDGRYFVHDVNLRLPSSVAISIKGGLDMPTLAVDAALDRADTLARVRLRRGVTYVWLGGEARALRSELGAGSARGAARALASFTASVAWAGLVPWNVLDRTPFRERLKGLLPGRSRTRPAGDGRAKPTP